MEQALEQPARTRIETPGFQEAWLMVIGQLQTEMRRGDFESWVRPLQPLSFKEGVYRVGALNPYARDWVESHLRSKISKLLEMQLGKRVNLHFSLIYEYEREEAGQQPAPRGAGGQGQNVPAGTPSSAGTPATATDQTPPSHGQPPAPDRPVSASDGQTPASVPSASKRRAAVAARTAIAAPVTGLAHSQHSTAGLPTAIAEPQASQPLLTETDLPLIDLPAEPPARGGGSQDGSGGSRNGSRSGGSQNGSGKSPKMKEAPTGPDSPRKIQLQRAYGTARARVIQPERGMFLTMYFFNNWLPLLGHSALTTVIAARSLCYWNPLTGELRNVVETDMSELASRAAVSVRTVKDVLNHPLVKKYFLRYKVRRIMTANGVRTAGIILQVRMDDPLTPEDQDAHDLEEEERWYTAEFEDESEE